MDDADWKIPLTLQPSAEQYVFDLDQRLQSLVGLRALVPPDAFTADILGIERSGSGVVIRDDGLVLTIGYLVTEADTVWLTSHDGKVVPAHVVGIDYASGLALVQPLGRLRVPPVEIGEAAELDCGHSVLFAACGGRRRAIQTQVISRETFAGNWEYILDRPIFTAPAHPFWGGGAIINAEGLLVGIGSLVLQQAEPGGKEGELNMAVPADLILPVLNDLLMFGRASPPARPWLGLYCVERNDDVVVQTVVKGGPAESAQIHRGDRIEAVGSVKISDLVSLWRAVWNTGPAGSVVPLTLRRGKEVLDTVIASADRSSFLRGPKLH
jgi:S1-C subfamily serine protease